MKLEIQVPEELAEKMEKYDDVDWDSMVLKALDGLVHDFTILDKLKDFWGTKRKEKQKSD
mgnify:CR=1 FL=1